MLVVVFEGEVSEGVVGAWVSARVVTDREFDWDVLPAASRALTNRE
jgi:hypothetical protein